LPEPDIETPRVIEGLAFWHRRTSLETDMHTGAQPALTLRNAPSTDN
jgi:hypothetical protein